MVNTLHVKITLMTNLKCRWHNQVDCICCCGERIQWSRIKAQYYAFYYVITQLLVEKKDVIRLKISLLITIIKYY